MSDPNALSPDPSLIGGVPKPPLVRLSDPQAVFAQRAARLTVLAENSHLKPYLEFLAAISDAQHAIVPILPEPILPAPETIARARQFDMPPIDRHMLKSDAIVHATCRALFKRLAHADMPEAAAGALAHLSRTDDAVLDSKFATVMKEAIPADDLAAQLFVAAGLQVHFVRVASRLDANALVPIGVGVCPVCGGRPSTSLIVGWYGAEGARYASCSLCTTLWNEVRVKCLACGSTKGIGYQEIEGGAGDIKAETCDECGGYVKVLYQQKSALLDPVADDVASLGLDHLMRESAYYRAGLNPYLAGY